MHDDDLAHTPASEEHNRPEEIPQALRRGGMAAWMLDTLLGLLGLGLAVWFGLRRPTIAVLLVALLLIGYALVHVWQRYEERPDRGRRVRRT